MYTYMVRGANNELSMQGGCEVLLHQILEAAIVSKLKATGTGKKIVL